MMRGPGPGRRGQPMPPMSMKGQWGLLVRVMKMVMKHYKLHFIVVLACIAAAMICSTQSSLFTQDLFNIYIPGITFQAVYRQIGMNVF